MKEKEYERVLLFSGVLSTIGFPEKIKERLEEKWGKIIYTSPTYSFDYTDYYVPEMGEGIKRFFIVFDSLISPDSLAKVKTFTNDLENEFAENGERKINLDPGTMSISNVILATTKNRAHRIAIGDNLFAEVTLIYHHSGFESFSWTYSDYKDPNIQEELLKIREIYKEKRKELAKSNS